MVVIIEEQLALVRSTWKEVVDIGQAHFPA